MAKPQFVLAMPDSPHYASVTSRHRTLEAARRRYVREVRALRRVPGQERSYLQRVILCTTQTASRVAILPEEFVCDLSLAALPHLIPS